MKYTTKQGDCISSVAYKHGFFPDTIWSHPKNQKLKENREDPNVLLPNDILHIPEKTLKWETKPTENRHRFIRKGVPAWLRIRILDDEKKTMAKESYKLEIDGVVKKGALDNNGMLNVPISPIAGMAKLTIGNDPISMVLNISLGTLDPNSTSQGIQGRLEGLGFFEEGNEDDAEQQKKTAILRFQEFYGLIMNGELTEETLSKIREIYGR